jgi:chromosome partitioning protein
MRPSPPDTPDPANDPRSGPERTGSVTLIETPPSPAPPSAPEATSPPPAADPSAASPEPSTAGGGFDGLPAQKRIKETISDVATAHAELDNVLPPNGGSPAPGPAPPRSDRPVRRGEPDRVADTPVDPGAAAVAAARPVGEAASARPDASAKPPGGGPAGSVTEVPPTEVRPARVQLDEPQPAEPPTSQDEEGPSTEADQEAISEVQSASGNPLPRVLAVANQKGGVGKTTTSVNLGAALAELGFRVLVIDLDPQGNATTGLGIDARNFELSMYDVLMRDSSLEDCVEPTSMRNLFVAPATIALAGAEIELVPAFSRELKLKKSIESVIDDFDYVLIDCPPSLGLITVNALAAADEVLVPIQCEYYALEGLSQLMRNVHLVASNLNPKLDISTIVLTMYDARTKLADQVANEVRLHFGAKVCRSVIPRTVRLSEAPSFGQPITAFDPTSRGAIAYRELAKEVSGGTT